MPSTYELFEDKPGYVVSETGLVNFPYTVTGPRSTWHMMRNQHNPYLLSATNDKIGGVSKIRGFEWFTDKSGRLEPARVL